MVPREVMHKGLNLIHSPAMLSIAESDFLYDVAASFKEPVSWVELGVWVGRSFWAAGCGLPAKSRIMGADLFTGELPLREGSEKIIQYAPSGNMQEKLARAVMNSLWELRLDSKDPLASVGLQRMPSHELPHYVRDVDVLVIDAAHDYESVCRDIDAWLPTMKPHGLIIGHDYGGKFHGVTRAFDERFGDKVQAVPGTRFCRVQL